MTRYRALFDGALMFTLFAVLFISTAALAGIWYRVARWFAGGPL